MLEGLYCVGSAPCPEPSNPYLIEGMRTLLGREAEGVTYRVTILLIRGHSGSPLVGWRGTSLGPVVCYGGARLRAQALENALG